MKFISPAQIIQRAIANAINSNFQISLEPREISINICYPKYAAHYTSTIALAISKRLGVEALQIAEAIAQSCSQNLEISSQWQIQPLGKGWLNICLRQQYLYENLWDLERWQPDGMDYCQGFWQKTQAIDPMLLKAQQSIVGHIVEGKAQQYAYARCCALIRLAERESLLPDQYLSKIISGSLVTTLGSMEPLEVSLFLQNLAIAEFLNRANQNSPTQNSKTDGNASRCHSSSGESILARSQATAFLNFYDRCRIFGVSQPLALRRLLLIKITQKLMLAIAPSEISYTMYL